MAEPKVVIVAKDGKAEADVRIGCTFHTLEDQTTVEFTTNSLEDFVKYIAGQEECFVAYGIDQCSLVPFLPKYSSRVVAQCKLQKSPWLKHIESKMGTPIAIKDFEELLSSMRFYLDDNAKTVWDIAKNFKLAKITQIEQQKDRSGNYHYSITRAKADGKDDVSIPEQIGFKIPICEGLKDEAKFLFDLFFDYVEHDGEVQVVFTFKNFGHAELVKAVMQKMVLDYLQPVDLPKFCGTATIIQATDAWKYQESAVD